MFNLGKCGNEQARYLGVGGGGVALLCRPYNGVCVVHGKRLGAWWKLVLLSRVSRQCNGVLCMAEMY